MTLFILRHYDLNILPPLLAYLFVLRSSPYCDVVYLQCTLRIVVEEATKYLPLC